MRTFQLSKQVYIKSGFTIVGPKEGDGNFADKFDIVLKNDIWCEKSFEKCESKMHRDAVSGAIKKAGLKREDIDIMLGGDLLNELAATSLAARNFPCAFLGLYNACSTFSESIIVGAMLIEGGFANSVVSPAMEYNREGVFFGVCAKMFVIAGPIIVFGVVASFVVGFIGYFVYM